MEQKVKQLEVAAALVDEINKQSNSNLPIIWCELNAWKFPSFLDTIKPDWWDGSSKEVKKYVSQYAMQTIGLKIPKKTLLYYWNNIYTYIGSKRDEIISRLLKDAPALNQVKL